MTKHHLTKLIAGACIATALALPGNQASAKEAAYIDIDNGNTSLSTRLKQKMGSRWYTDRINTQGALGTDSNQPHNPNAGYWIYVPPKPKQHAINSEKHSHLIQASHYPIYFD